MGSNNGKGDRDGWARLRFAVVGPLLASPPAKGRLRAELERLARQSWKHPTSGGQVQFSVSTIERWYYQARAAHQDPVKALRRRARTDVGRVRTMSAVLIAALRDQYRAHPSWSAQLHHDNLQARVEADPSLGPMPSYTTLTRVLRSLGLVRRRRRPRFEREPERPAVEAREVLSYEVSRSHALWHALCRGRCYVSVSPLPRAYQGIPPRNRNIMRDTDSCSMIVLSRSRRHDHVREVVRATAHD